MSSVIAPAVLAENAEQYKEIMGKVSTFAHRVHIDISDGEFAPTFTINAQDAWWSSDWQADIHMMVARPSEHLAVLQKLKPSLVIFHAEVQEDLLASMKQLQSVGIKAGIALQRSTVPMNVKQLIEAADHVMIFSGDLGHYGGTASLMQLEKVRLIRAIKPHVEVGWDGGVNVDNAYSLSQGGVEVLNVGGAIAKQNDPAAAYKALVDEINKHGVI